MEFLQAALDWVLDHTVHQQAAILLAEHLAAHFLTHRCNTSPSATLPQPRQCLNSGTKLAQQYTRNFDDRNQDGGRGGCNVSRESLSCDEAS
jgi:hypothetical protein